MTYTEVKKRNGKNYYYRVLSFRNNKSVSKKRTYLGVDLSAQELAAREGCADKMLDSKREKMLETIKSQIVNVLRAYNIKKAGLFGSYATGKNKKKSDVDLLVQPPKNIGLGFVKLQFELEKKIGKKVDLVTYNSIHPLLRERILREEVRIL